MLSRRSHADAVGFDREHSLICSTARYISLAGSLRCSIRRPFAGYLVSRSRMFLVRCSFSIHSLPDLTIARRLCAGARRPTA